MLRDWFNGKAKETRLIGSRCIPISHCLDGLMSCQGCSHVPLYSQEKVREKSRECQNHKPQPLPDTKRKRKQTKPNKHKSNKRTKSTKISYYIGYMKNNSFNTRFG